MKNTQKTASSARWMALGLVAAASLAWAQEGGSSPDRITVPFSDPARAKTVKVSLINGSVIVRGYDGKELIVEAKGGGRRLNSPPPPRADGLRRIDQNGNGFEVTEDNNVVKISLGIPIGNPQLTLQVPRDTSLNIRLVSGNIDVEGVGGEVDLNAVNGSVNVRSVTGAVSAHSLNGPLKASIDRVGDKPMSFSSLNGEIDVTLPAATKANFKLKSDFGEIYTDFDVRMNKETQKPPTMETTKDGRRRMMVEKYTYAAVNGGGPEIQFTTLNGRIYIRKGK